MSLFQLDDGGYHLLLGGYTAGWVFAQNPPGKPSLEHWVVLLLPTKYRDWAKRKQTAGSHAYHYVGSEEARPLITQWQSPKPADPAKKKPKVVVQLEADEPVSPTNKANKYYGSINSSNAYLEFRKQRMGFQDATFPKGAVKSFQMQSKSIDVVGKESLPPTPVIAALRDRFLSGAGLAELASSVQPVEQEAAEGAIATSVVEEILRLELLMAQEPAWVPPHEADASRLAFRVGALERTLAKLQEALSRGEA